MLGLTPSSGPDGGRTFRIDGPMRELLARILPPHERVVVDQRPLLVDIEAASGAQRCSGTGSDPREELVEERVDFGRVGGSRKVEIGRVRRGNRRLRHDRLAQRI